MSLFHGFDSYVSFQVIDDQRNFFFTPGRYVKDHSPFFPVHGLQDSHPVVPVQDEFQKVDLAAIHPVESFLADPGCQSVTLRYEEFGFFVGAGFIPARCSVFSAPLRPCPRSFFCFIPPSHQQKKDFFPAETLGRREKTWSGGHEARPYEKLPF
jgi:hypothetical protein